LTDQVKNTLDYVYAHIHPDDQANIDVKRRYYLQGKTEMYEVVFRFRDADQEWKWYKGKGKILDRDDDNGPINMVGKLADITERKLAEEQIRKDEKQIRASEKRWRSLIEQERTL
tara:strand:+ start:14779 stop:15123 length:345 start_codon:yes stop_codon:yes gene_type:complete